MGGSLHPQQGWAIPVLLVLAFISGAGYVLWALLMKNNPISRIAIFGLIIPIMNVLLSACSTASRCLSGSTSQRWRWSVWASS